MTTHIPHPFFRLCPHNPNPGVCLDYIFDYLKEINILFEKIWFFWLHFWFDFEPPFICVFNWHCAGFNVDIFCMHCVLRKCVSPFYNCYGWLGVKNQLSVYLRTIFLLLQSVQREPDVPVSHSPVRVTVTQCYHVRHTDSHRNLLYCQENDHRPLPEAAERAVSIKRCYGHSESNHWLLPRSGHSVWVETLGGLLAAAAVSWNIGQLSGSSHSMLKD